jgi:hypothetical protein
MFKSGTVLDTPEKLETAQFNRLNVCVYQQGHLISVPPHTTLNLDITSNWTTINDEKCHLWGWHFFLTGRPVFMLFRTSLRLSMLIMLLILVSCQQESQSWVKSTSPEDGVQNVPSKTPIIISFNQQMDESRVDGDPKMP